MTVSNEDLLATIGRLYMEGILLRAKVAELQAQVDQLASNPKQ